MMTAELKAVWVAVYSASFENRARSSDTYLDAAMAAMADANKAVAHLSLLGGVPLTVPK